ncbi:sensor histidine kinase [Klebsiella pneumoniae]
MRLSKFILTNLGPILQQWDEFAATILPAATTMNAEQLRDHAEQMLRAISSDLEREQSFEDRLKRSRGLGPHSEDETPAEVHAVTRLMSGFTIDQMISEYRALRVSVLHLWGNRIKTGTDFEAEDIARFNESMDQALAESVARYSRAAQESQNIFLGILGHDLRTPLGAINLGAQVLLRTDDLDSRYTKIASRIFTSVERADQIVANLLDFTRTRLGAGIPIHVDQTDVAEVCRNMVEEVRAYHPDSTIVFEAQGETLGQFDGARLEQVFSNLITNAIQHGSMGTPITVKLVGENGHVVATVHNDGIPIKQEDVPHIFNPMTRYSRHAASSRGPHSGLGLGLYIAKEIVTAHRGSISVSSTAEQGTSFVVDLPIRQA